MPGYINEQCQKSPWIKTTEICFSLSCTSVEGHVGSALGLSLALPGHFRLHASTFAEAGVKYLANHRLVPAASS